ncbi:predicted protein [Aspergillus nidulans FGSC A4]|uniref:Uncharacterized protein n=1 Tax=Emericella nidulans (strain FGSC A4 / ATCC 38163 / CBS 112.46 / NRRL 194 / M139) TaxID=227321 RepID=Q5B4U4_EMENI|nr:hypothetical protein [Aspergillus nidulans FGSC A4]EAA60201.1 predicted protein [Aspergillus nidulans FGSC A4]CBF77528.1 TPA: conserved hypothetical protein [Aspergillus nidulans FGSC A4]|eukprot:XP_662040.1 predicted protein [Aspergillus nidulans FGSC A4]
MCMQSRLRTSGLVRYTALGGPFPASGNLQVLWGFFPSLSPLRSCVPLLLSPRECETEGAGAALSEQKGQVIESGKCDRRHSSSIANRAITNGSPIKSTCFDWGYRKYAKKGWIQLHKRSYNNDVNSRVALARGQKSRSDGLVDIKDMSNLAQQEPTDQTIIADRVFCLERPENSDSPSSTRGQMPSGPARGSGRPSGRGWIPNRETSAPAHAGLKSRSKIAAEAQSRMPDAHFMHHPGSKRHSTEPQSHRAVPYEVSMHDTPRKGKHAY